MDICGDHASHGPRLRLTCATFGRRKTRLTALSKQCLKAARDRTDCGGSNTHLEHFKLSPLANSHANFNSRPTGSPRSLRRRDTSTTEAIRRLSVASGVGGSEHSCFVLDALEVLLSHSFFFQIRGFSQRDVSIGVSFFRVFFCSPVLFFILSVFSLSPFSAFFWLPFFFL